MTGRLQYSHNLCLKPRISEPQQRFGLYLGIHWNALSWTFSHENGGAKRGRGLSAFVLVTATGRRQEILVSIEIDIRMCCGLDQLVTQHHIATC